MDPGILSTRPLLGQGDLEVTIEGLEYMNDDPGEVDVLYAKVQEHSGRLQVLCRKRLLHCKLNFSGSCKQGG